MSIGLDIGSKTIKVVEVANEKGASPTLKTAAIVGHTTSDIEKMQDEKEYANLAGVVKKLCSDAHISSKKIHLSLPESGAFVRAVHFPLLSDQEIASAIRWEAEEYIPIPVAEAIISYQILERRENTNPPEVIVLLIAAPRILVEKYVRIAEIAGLVVSGIETSLLSVVRSLVTSNQTTVLVDCGAKSTNLCIVKNTQLMLSRSIPTAGDVFSRAIAQSLGVSETQAEEYKRTYGVEKGELGTKISRSLEPVIATISDEIVKAMRFYQTEQSAEPPTSVVLCGGSAGMPGIVSALARNLGMEIVIGNPFGKLVVDPKMSAQLVPYLPLYSGAVGLALRES